MLRSLPCAAPLALCACVAPDLDSLQPARAYPGQLVGVHGANDLAWIVWDAGTPTETEIQTGVMGTRYFQVPKSASAGFYEVALRNSSATSSPRTIEVLPPHAADFVPRIEDVAVVAIQLVDGRTDVLLTVSAANLDTEAELFVDGQPVERAFWGGLPLDLMQDREPETFGYPVFHYGQVIGRIENAPLGQTILVEVVNEDGASDQRTYDLAPSGGSLDGDGDGLLDVWEISGYPVPDTSEVIDLSDFGCEPGRKDLLIEVDWMPKAAPDPGLWQAVAEVFANAPVINPDGTVGIHVAIDRGQGDAFTQGGSIGANFFCLSMLGGSADWCQTVSFYDLSSQHFAAGRRGIFRYGLFGIWDPELSSGWGEPGGDEFMITFSEWAEWASLTAQVGSFVHELGHNLGLAHGGVEGLGALDEQVIAYKPNLPSSMNYRWTFTGISDDCDLLPEGYHTYSQGMLAEIDEKDLDESVGLCDHTPLDLNANGTVADQGSFSVSSGPYDTEYRYVLRDFDQWGNLKLGIDVQP